MTRGNGVAPHASGSERQRLPGMSHVVQAITIGALTILPCLPPRNAGQDKHYWSGAIGQTYLEIADSTLFGHVRRRSIMIQPIGPFLQAARQEVELGRMQIARGWIHAQRIPVSRGRNNFGRADRRGVEE